MDNCGLETIFSLMQEPQSETWPDFSLPESETAHVHDEICLDSSDILPVFS
jgi:hypothetical protein